MQTQDRLGAVEWEIMEQVWVAGDRVTVRDVHTRLCPNGEKAYTTVQTMMNSLADKKVLAKEKIGLVNFYLPAVSREQMARLETQSLAKRIYKGSFGALANHLISAEDLTPEELDQLRALIESKSRELGQKGE
jgi:predicted transcriptional regulator